MADASKDPLAVWREMFAQWEKGFNQAANKAMGSEEFSRSVNQATQTSMQLQQSMGDMIARYLALMNLPGRAEFTGIEERLRGIEDGVNRIAAALERAREPGAAPRVVAPPRTKRPAKRGGS